MLRILSVLPALSAFIILGCSIQVQTSGKSAQNVVVPLELTSHRPVLELTIDGKGPFRFLFDTGSSTNIIKDGLDVELGLEVVGADSLRTPGSDDFLVSNRVKAPGVRISNTDIQQDIEMNLLPMPWSEHHGVLGPSFFSDYLLTIDYAASKLILSKGELNRTDPDIVPLLQDSGMINFEVTVGGNTLEAHLDSGNPGRVALPFSLKDKLKFVEPPSEAGVVSTPVTSFKRWDAVLNGDLKIGGVAFANPKVHLMEGFEFANFGYQIFEKLRITIDQKNGLIRFEKSAVPAGKIAKDLPVGEQNDYTGWYGGQERRIILEKGKLFLQRVGGPRLALVKVGNEEFEMTFNMPVMNELPKVRFVRDDENEVIGLTFVFKDGREEFIKKDR